MLVIGPLVYCYKLVFVSLDYCHELVIGPLVYCYEHVIIANLFTAMSS